MIVFRDAGMRARIARLRDLGVPTYAAPVAAHCADRSALLQSPDGTPLLLLEEDMG
jgi:hypothetical protein